MAKGRKTGGRDFQPGAIANPKGRPKLSEDEKLLRSFTAGVLTRLLDELFFMSDHQVKAILSNPESHKIKRILASVLNKAEVFGDFQRLDGLLNRKIGKVTDKVEHSLPRATIVHKPSDGTRMELGAKKSQDEDQDK